MAQDYQAQIDVLRRRRDVLDLAIQALADLAADDSGVVVAMPRPGRRLALATRNGTSGQAA